MLRELLQPNPPTDNGALVAFGLRYNLELPVPYREFLLRNNGGQPVRAVFPIEGMKDNSYGRVQSFFGLKAEISVYDLDAIMADLLDLIPRGVLPIACTEGYDFLCLDLRNAGASVVFWDRKPFWGTDIWSEGDLFPVADSFDSLLSSLRAD